MVRAFATLALALAAAACTPSIPDGRFACDTDADCPPGQVCDDADDRCHTPDGG